MAYAVYNPVIIAGHILQILTFLNWISGRFDPVLTVNIWECFFSVYLEASHAVLWS